MKVCPLKQNIYEKREAKLATKDRQRNWKQIVKTNFQFFIPCLHLYTIMYSIMQWICIHFLRIRIQLFISMRIRQPFKSGFGSSITKFITNYKELKKTTKIYQKLKTMELVYIKLIFSNKITISTNFPAFFSPQKLWMRIHSPGSKFFVNISKILFSNARFYFCFLG